MKRANKLILFVSFIILISYLPAFPFSTGAAEGIVKDALTGEVIPEAKVTFTSTKSGLMKYEVISDKKGHFYKGGLIIGSYNVTAEKEGYLPASASLRVRLQETAKIDVTLKTFESLVPKSEKALQEGSKLLGAGRFEEAAQVFTEAILEDQENPTLYYYRGGAFEKSGETDKAVDDYQKAIELKDDFILPLSRLGMIHAKQGNVEKAVESFNQAIELGDQDTTTHYNFGVCLMNSGNNEKAREVFENLITLDNEYSDAYYHLSILYIGQGMTQDAKDLLQKFIEMDPDNSNAPIAKEILKSLG